MRQSWSAGVRVLSFATLATGMWLGTQLAHAQPEAPAGGGAITATIDTSQVAEPVSPYIYGGFIEHIGPLVYRSMWSEVIDDRKFYFPISSKDQPAPAGNAARAARLALNKWRPVGGDDVVTMDKDRPFVGEHSPSIRLDASAPHGIRQAGLTLVSGKPYSGRIFLRGTANTKVQVSLIWGPGAGDRQTVSVPITSADYKKYPLNFTPKADTADGAIEITATGSGDFHVGTLSLMPTDNVQGFRRDTIGLLAELHSGMWRLPGGNYLSDWSWYDSVGDIDKRPPMFDYAWNAMQPNDVGMDEFMTLCKLIGVEPYITVNAGFGDSHSAAEEVEYINGSTSTRLGAMRARNGHPEPYHVKFWNVGNEPYGTWQLGHTDLKYYVLKHNEFAKAMRQVDPSITILASGAMPDEMTVEGQSRQMHLDPQAQFGSDADWTGGLLAHSWGNFDGLTEHWYSRVGKRFDYEHAKTLRANAGNEEGYVPVEETQLEWIRHPSSRVHTKAEEWQEYEKRFPAMQEKKIFLSIDEYSYSGAPANLKTSLAYGMILNEMLRHTGFMKMAAYTMGTGRLDITPTAAVLNTNGVLYKLYADHYGSLPVSVGGNSPQPAPKYPPYGDQPKTSAGSPTYPLDVVAALTKDRRFLTVAVINGTDTAQKLNLNVTGGLSLAGKPTLWEMTGNTVDATDLVGKPQQVEAKEVSAVDTAGTITVAPISVNIYSFPVKGQ